MSFTQVLSSASLLTFLSFGPALQAQPEIMPWGNIRSFHVGGEKLVVETSLRSVKPDWSGFISSERCNWQGTQTYSFEGKTTKMSHFLQALPLNYAQTFHEKGEGSVDIDLSIDASDDIEQAGTYFCVEVPGSEFVDGGITIYSGETQTGSAQFEKALAKGRSEYVKAKGNRIVVKSATREFEVVTDSATEIFVKQAFLDRPHHLNDPLPAKTFVDSDPLRPIADYQVYFTLIDGKANKGVQKKVGYTIHAKGTVDQKDIVVALEPEKVGRKFAGVGSNYRTMDLKRDAEVINYCLERIRVTWGRIAFDWKDWQPEETRNGLARAREGKLTKSFYDQVELARQLAKRKMPLIATVWGPPDWAVDFTKQNRLPLEHDTKLSLNPKKIQAMCDSIADYIQYLKTDHGIEIPLFSFNEVDYGVLVYHTPEEHAFYTKAIGSAFAARGLKTKILLGDTGACTIRSNKIILPAVDDPSIHPYIGAVGFHTWHGCTTADLKAWALSAEKLNVPLLAVEGGPNSALHRYPNQFLERWFQLSEIDLYVRILRDAQVETVMEWQLTPDYNVLTGNGYYGDTGPLRPTQRFWNLKQLGSTPEGSFSIPAQVTGENVSVAALADPLHGLYTVHLVNNSAKRKAIVRNIPAGVKELNVYQTDITRGMQPAGSVPVKDGVAEVMLDSACYTTVTNAVF